MATLSNVSKKHHKRINNPFPTTPKSLPLLSGALFSHLEHTSGPPAFGIGSDFQLLWSSQNGGSLSISHNSMPGKAIFATKPGKAFVSAALAETEAEESRGSFAIKDRKVHFVCRHQSVDEIRVVNQMEELYEAFDRDPSPASNLEATQFPAVIIKGWVFSSKKAEKYINGDLDPSVVKRHTHAKLGKVSVVAKYWVLFDQKNYSQVGFQVKFGPPNWRLSISSPTRKIKSMRKKFRLQFHCLSRSQGFSLLMNEVDEFRDKAGESLNFNRVVVTYSSERDEKFFGFGEQFSHMEFKGRRVPIFVQEQGIGRGDQPITFAANLVSYRSGGDRSTTYAPSPFYMTSKMRSIYLEGYSYSVFDLTRADRVQIQVYSNSVRGRILHGSSPVELIERFTDTAGRPELPNWILSGAVIGMQGGTDAVVRVWNQLKKLNIPISAFWLQDWAGQRKTIIGSQLWWNWEVDEDRYPGWTQLVDDLRAANVKMMAYCNPCLAPVDGKPNAKQNLFEEATKLGLLVKDKNGETYMIPNTAFSVGMLDLTNPAAIIWFKKILREMVDSGVRGWMADFGEGLPLDACLFNGEDPITAHNKYPELWAQVNREFVEEWKLSQDGKDPDDNLVFFMRAGFRESPKWGMLFWEGDQMVSWQKNDGIKSAVLGMLSSGLSGYAFNHSDTGGYCAVDIPLIRYRRSEELLLRWMELNAFNVVFRTHEGNKPAANVQFYSNRRTMSHFARFAKVYKAWEFYRIQLVKEASERGTPVARHLLLHFPDDEHVQNITYQQFMIGSEILVAPVLDKGAKKVKVYFPLTGGISWKHVWTGDMYGEPSTNPSSKQIKGLDSWIEAPIGYPALFVKMGSSIGETFIKNLEELNVLK